MTIQEVAHVDVLKREFAFSRLWLMITDKESLIKKATMPLIILL